MKAIVLAGGGGTRLWPLSRLTLPKQFLNLSTSRLNASLLIDTVHRCVGAGMKELDVHIITSTALLSQVYGSLLQAGLAGLSHNVIDEPVQRNTAPAIALAARFIEDKARIDDTEVLAILPADHVIQDASVFGQHLKEAELLARQGYIVTLGVPPTHPETGYGYIQTAPQQAESNYRLVQRFVEKPDFETARQYLNSGDFLWNAGIFVLTVGTLRQALQAHATVIADPMAQGYEHLREQFTNLPNISFDCAVMEKATHVAVIPMQTGWSDVGSWDSVMALHPTDEQGNVLKSKHAHLVETSNCMVWSESNRLVATIGMNDCLIVDTPDALLVARRGDSQRVREVVSKLQAISAQQAIEPIRVEEHWGIVERLNHAATDELALYRINFNSGQTIHLQSEREACQLQVLAGTAEQADSPTSLTPLSNLMLDGGKSATLQVGESGLSVSLIGALPDIRSVTPTALPAHSPA